MAILTVKVHYKASGDSSFGSFFYYMLTDLLNYNMWFFLASGSGRCEINNGGCWKDTKNGRTYSACTVSVSWGFSVLKTAILSVGSCPVFFQVKSAYKIWYFGSGVCNMQDDGCKCPDGFKGDGKHKCEGKRHFLRLINLSRSACLLLL